MAQKRNQRLRSKREINTSDIESESDENNIDILKQRKRSKSTFNIKFSRKKQDMLVLIIACIMIISTLGGYFYYIYFLFPSKTDESENNLLSSGNYTGELFVISDITHNWDEKSWHIINFNGATNFLLKVTNAGHKVDTYRLKLSDNNLMNKIQITFDKNNFELNPGRSTLIVVDIETNINYEYHVPISSIVIKLVSQSFGAVMDSVQIDLTVDNLNSEETALANHKVAAYYTGAFENGTLFDYSFSNPENQKALYISLSNDVQQDRFSKEQYVPVISGFKTGIIGMLPGETHVIKVQPENGYPSDHELGNKVLIFEVRLLSNDQNL